MKPTLFLLAAGMGSRYGGLKQLDGLGPNGETIMDYSIYDAINAGFGKLVFVIRKDFEQDFRDKIISKYEGHIPCEMVFQALDALPEGFTCPADRTKPWGTNHAVMMGADVIKEPFAVINCDDFYGRDSFQVMGKFLANLPEGAKNTYSMVGFRVGNTLSESGTVSRGICETNEKNLLPFLTGTICAHRCQNKCSRNFYDESVHIRDTKLVAAEHGYGALMASMKPTAKLPGKKAAIIGGGPTGIAAAYFLARGGVETTIFEREAKLGGVPRYVIPAFRISDEALDKDVALMERLGVEVKCDAPAPSVEELKKLGYTHILMATGAWQAGELGIPGNVKGVIGWMKEMKQQVKPCLEGHVVVVGAGNTAMDAARVAKRMGAASSTIVYRRTKKEMPADEHELKLAIDEGVKLVELAAPVEQKDGKLVCNQMKLGEPDASGRRSPVATGETFEIPCDLVISAIGEKVDAKLMAENGIEMGRKGPAFQTNVENVWSAGDAHRGPATVVEGIADAAAFAEAVIGKAHTYEIPEQAYPAKADAIAKKGILKMASCACCEGGRCLDCNTVCENCVDSCPNRANVVVKLADGRHEIVHVDKMCNECGNCTQFCPYASEPCHDKFTLFQTEKDMNESENRGVLFLGGDKIRVRLEKDEVLDLSQPNELPQDIETLILTLRGKYSYLYTE